MQLKLGLDFDELALELVEGIGQGLHLATLGHLLRAAGLDLLALLLHVGALLAATLDVLLDARDLGLLLRDGVGTLGETVDDDLPLVRLD